jgi:hypothetical protein
VKHDSSVDRHEKGNEPEEIKIDAKQDSKTSVSLKEQ